jgi:hypothetical protein
LLSSLGKIGIVLSSEPTGTSKGKGSKRDIGTEKNETHTWINNLNKPNDCVESEVAKLTNTQEGNRNTQLNVSAFNLALAGVDYESAYNSLIPLARSIGLKGNEIKPTFDSGYQAGQKAWLEEKLEKEKKRDRTPHGSWECQKVCSRSHR